MCNTSWALAALLGSPAPKIVPPPSFQTSIPPLSNMLANRFFLRNRRPMECPTAPLRNVEEECRPAPSALPVNPGPSSIGYSHPTHPHAHHRPTAQPRPRSVRTFLQSHFSPFRSKRPTSPGPRPASVASCIPLLSCFRRRRRHQPNPCPRSPPQKQDQPLPNDRTEVHDGPIISKSDLEMEEESFGSMRTALSSEGPRSHDPVLERHQTPKHAPADPPQPAPKASTTVADLCSSRSSTRQLPSVVTLLPHPVAALRYAVMEELDGPNLEMHLLRKGVLSERAAVRIMVQVLEAVCKMHRHGIGHLDIRPANIMVPQDYDQEDANVSINPGLAVQCLDPRMLSHPVCTEPHGTPVYAAPEVSATSPYAMEKADVWSCGITLFELLSGALPYQPLGFHGDRGFAAVTSVIHATGSVRNLYCGVDGSSSSKAPPCSLLCRELLGMCLELSPRNRPTARQALAALLALQASLTASEPSVT